MSITSSIVISDWMADRVISAWLAKQDKRELASRALRELSGDFYNVREIMTAIDAAEVEDHLVEHYLDRRA